ncbi:MAG: glycosyltransferase family 2 protein [Candidatus Marinimicrobia bacterium]|nr:glycosyltransferase family 2 protein [Candidatus Neomarinimicrobiota bacterium]
MLRECLASLSETSYPNFEIVVVDNASTDESISMVRQEFSEVKIIQLSSNKGYAGGCNAGIVTSEESDYIVLFNNDATAEKSWLTYLVEKMEADKSVSACQPKILSAKNRNVFDYSGAAGGMLDKYAYPFARGRIIATIEKDENQYDSETELFWASGTACILRNSALKEVGLLDETFFAHMEEIDLCWRMQLRGNKIGFVPESRVYHLSGATLSSDTFKKKYLNHRNSVLMMLKNYSLGSLVKLLPGRVIIDIIAMAYSLIVLDMNRFNGILAAFLWIILHPVYILKERAKVQGIRLVSDREIRRNMFDGSIALSYYLTGGKRVSDHRNR